MGVIVSEDKVELALDYLNCDPHPLALARKAVTDAEARVRQSFARAFLNANGSVDARKAYAELSSEYKQARAEEADALFELEKHKTRIKGAELLLSIFQTESANARNVDKNLERIR